jgi:hypothetical protein
VSKPLRLTICLLVVPAILASGCGSSKTATNTTTTSASATTTTSPPTSATTQTAGQSTGSSGPQQTSTTPAQKTTTATPKTPPSQPNPQASTPGTGATGTHASPGHVFPLELKQKFLAAWLAAHLSKSSGECVIDKFQAQKIIEGRALAEMVGFELALIDHFRLNPQSRQYAKECHAVA